MANFDMDFLNHSIPAAVAKMESQAPVHTWLTDNFFNAGNFYGTEGVDGVAFDWRRYTPPTLEEAVRGADPVRVNFKSDFNSDYVTPYYYYVKDKVGLEDSDKRVFGEDVSVSVSSSARVVKRFAEKIVGLRDAVKLNKEKMCADALFNGKCVNKAGEQKFPVASSLLNVSGAGITTDIDSVIEKAWETVNKKNKSFMPRVLVLNPVDAIKLTRSEHVSKLISKDTFNAGSIHFAKPANGAAYCGMLNVLGAADLEIWTYTGVDAAGNNYIPQGKGILAMGNVGGMAFGRLQAVDEKGMPCYRVQEERMTTYMEGQGDRVHFAVEYQTAPMPIPYKIDTWCILNGIA